MQRIDTASKAVDLFGFGKHGYKDGDRALGIAPTDFNAASFNAIQEEIANAIEYYGTTLDPGDLHQLSLALRKSVGIGAVCFFAMSSAPSGWLKANGAAISRSTYAALFAAIGTTFGVGDGATTFNIPDLRGEFIRGWDDGKGTDSGRVFGSAQGQAVNTAGVQLREASTTWTAASTGIGSSMAYFENADIPAYGTNIAVLGGTETRPLNIALLACIKY